MGEKGHFQPHSRSFFLVQRKVCLSKPPRTPCPFGILFILTLFQGEHHQESSQFYFCCCVCPWCSGATPRQRRHKLGRPKVVSPAPKSLPYGRARPLPYGRHRGPFWGKNSVLGVKTPQKRETRNLVKRPLFEQKHQKPTCGTMVWVICAANHSPQPANRFLEKGSSPFPRIFSRCQNQ